MAIHNATRPTSKRMLRVYDQNNEICIKESHWRRRCQGHSPVPMYLIGLFDQTIVTCP